MMNRRELGKELEKIIPGKGKITGICLDGESRGILENSTETWLQKRSETGHMSYSPQW